MFAGRIYAPRRIELIDAPEPLLDGKSGHGNAGGEILFQPQLAALCGSDLLFFEAEDPEHPPRLGHSLHEMIGVVTRTNGDRFRVGDRALCVPEGQRGIFERFRASERHAVPLDPRLSDEQATLSQPLGTVICALKKMPSVLDLDVAVVGQGPIGQLFCAALRNLGAREIVAIDPVGSRLQTSPRMGATTVIDPSRQEPIDLVREVTRGRMMDLVVEAVGHEDQALNLCIHLCRKGGRILYFGLPYQTIDGVHWRALLANNITVHTSIGPDFDRDFPLAMRWLAENRIDVDPLITHRFPIRQIQQAFDTFRERREGALKVLIEFPELAIE